MEHLGRYFANLERKHIYILSEIPGMGMEYFLLKLLGHIEKEHAITWVDFVDRPLSIQYYYEKLYSSQDKSIIINENVQKLQEKLDLDFNYQADKNVRFLDEEPFYKPYSFDRLLKHLKTYPTDILIINEFTSFLESRDIHDQEERNWIMKEFQRVAQESNTVLLLVYNLEIMLPEGSFIPELKHFHWSRNMVNIAREIYFLYRYDYFTGDSRESHDTARLMDLKQFSHLSEELENFSPAEMAHGLNFHEVY